MKIAVGDSKTAIILALHGPGAVHVRRRMFSQTKATFPVVLDESTVCVPLVTQYKHLTRKDLLTMRSGLDVQRPEQPSQ